MCPSLAENNEHEICLLTKTTRYGVYIEDNRCCQRHVSGCRPLFIMTEAREIDDFLITPYFSRQTVDTCDSCLR